MEDKQTQKERRVISERRMLKAAIQIAADKGVERLSLTEVGIRAGFSRGLASHHFGSKDNLLAAMASAIGEHFSNQVKYQSKIDGLAHIVSVVDIYFSRRGDGWVNTRALLNMMAAGASHEGPMNDIVLSYNRKARDHLAEQVRIGQRRAEISKQLKPEAVATLLLAVFRGAMLQSLNDPALDLNEVKNSVIYVVKNLKNIN